MKAHVEAAAARLDVADQRSGAVALQTSVRLEPCQPTPAGDRELQPFEDGARQLARPVDPLDRPRATSSEGLDEGDQRRLELTPDHRICHGAEQVVGVEGGVEPIETDVTPRIGPTDLFGHADAEPQRRVHRDRDPDEARARRLLPIEALDADVQRLRGEPRALQEPERRGEAERLVAELVAGDQQDGARAPQRLGERFVDALLHASISTSVPVTRTG